MLRRVWPCFYASVALLAITTELAAQRVPGRQRAEADVHARLLALGSIGTDIDRPHVAGGGLFQFGYRRASVFALGMIGTGGDYASRLAGGGLAVRLATVGPLELGAFGGYGLYAEKGWSGIERDAGGVLAGAMVSARLGSFTVALAFSDLTGEYDEDDVSAPFRFHVPRLSLGVGF